MASLASAFVNIVPGTKDIDKYLKTQLPADAAATGKPTGEKLGKGMGESFGSTFKSVLGPVLASLAAGFSAVAITNFAKEGVLAAAGLNTGIAEVVSLTGTVGTEAAKNFGQFKDLIKDVSNEFGIAQDILTKGLYNALSAGVPKENALDFMQVASRASIAGVTDVNTAVDGLTTVINAFGLEIGDAGSVADQMFTAVKGGKTTFEELSSSMFQVAPAAAAAGVDFGEVNAAIATLTAAGVPTRVATTQIRAALVSLQRPTDDMTKLFNDLGYESAQQAIEQEGLSFAMSAVMDAADGSNGEMIKLLGSVEAVSAVQVLAGTGAEKFASELVAQAEAAGAAQAAFDVIDPTRSLDKAGIAVDNLKVEIGDRLLPVVESVANFVTANLLPAFDKAAAFFEEYGLAIGVFVGVLGGLLTIINLVQIATKIWTILQGAFNVVMALNPVVLIVIAIAALTAAIVYLATKTTFFQDLWKAMTESVSSAWESFKQMFEAAVTAIGNFFNLLATNLKQAWNTAVKDITSLWEGFKKAFEVAAKAIEKFWKGTTDFIKSVFDSVVGFIKGLWDGLVSGIEAGAKQAGEFFESIWNGITDFFKSVVNGYITIFENFFNFVIDGANGLIRMLNKIKLDIPATPFSDAFTIGVNLPTLDRLNLPRLAEGGYVDSATMAIIGEAGPEVVVPLKDFERMMGMDGNGRTINYYAAPNQSLDSEEALFQAMRRARVVAQW
jgi:TP901 family phage tail tape measure protein